MPLRVITSIVNEKGPKNKNMHTSVTSSLNLRSYCLYYKTLPFVVDEWHYDVMDLHEMIMLAHASGHGLKSVKQRK